MKETSENKKTNTDANLAIMKNMKENKTDEIKLEDANKSSLKEVPIVKTETSDPIREKWKEESRLVKGVFRCHEPQGGSVTFSFKKYKWDPIRTYTFSDGQEYEIPLAVARHLNQNCNYPVHSYILDAQGNPTVDQQGKKISRMNFEGLEFNY